MKGRLDNVVLASLSQLFAIDKDGTINPNVSNIPGLEALKSAETIASMSQDLMKGRKTEIDHMNGAVAALGEKYGLPCPVNAAMATMIRYLEADGR